MTVACQRLPLVAGPDEPCELGAHVKGGHYEPEASGVVPTPRKRAWEAQFGGELPARGHLAARLVGWPAHLLADRRTLPTADRAFLRRLARDTWRGLAAFTDREHALPVDHVELGPTLARADARVGDYTNVTSVGLYLTAIVAANELHLVRRKEALARVAAVLHTLDGLETYDGFFFNYYDTTSLERTSDFVSFIDSAWLTAGLVVVRQAFPEIADACRRLVGRADYRFFYDPDTGRMRHGYWAHPGRPSRFHYGMLYAESRLGSLIAIGKGDVPAEHWFRMLRTLPASCTWQTQAPHGRHLETVRGYHLFGGWYEWRGVHYVPSWGGSMFEALMPTLVLDEARLLPESLGRNDVAHAEVQRRAALDDLRYPVWGLSSSEIPDGQGYSEYGIRALGVLGYGAGAVTPHASALALAVTPRQAEANLRTLARRYDVYGDFGFYDAVDPVSGTVAPVYLTLDQAMTFIAVANRLCGGCVQQRFESDPIVAAALPVVAVERFFD
jgi:hypothetical protein